MLTQSPQHLQGNAPLYWLALGTFAVGTESLMIAGLLPGMAADLAVRNLGYASALSMIAAIALATASLHRQHTSTRNQA